MVLASFEGESNSANNALWRSSCENLMQQIIESPYLYAIFGFLSSSSNYKAVLSDCDIGLPDKIGFSCQYLDDDQLKEFLAHNQKEVVNKGDLEGLILTGIDSVGGGLNLLQSYLDNTGDIQTVALILSHVSINRVKDRRIGEWTETYQELLDHWQLWFERARFDVGRSKNLGGRQNISPQVFARCNFCNTNLTLGRESTSIVGRGRGFPRLNAQSKAYSKVSICPNCSKPLPRCSLCLLNFDCTPSDPRTRQFIDGGSSWHSGSHPFDYWFTWCQTCKHGGHAKHIFEWFAIHDECPVTDCHCKCDLG